MAALTITGIDRNLAITPDGSRVVFVGNNGRELLARPLEALDPVRLVRRRSCAARSYRPTASGSAS